MSIHEYTATRMNGSRALAARIRAGLHGIFRRTALIALVLIVWQLLPTLEIVNSFLVPPPSEVLKTVVTLAGPNSQPAPFILEQHIALSVFRIMAGVAIGVVIGVPLGMLTGTIPLAARIFNPIRGVLLPVPSLAWAPILIVALGLNNKTTIAVVAIEATLVIAYNSELGTSSVSEHYKWAVRSMGGSSRDVFFRVLVPSTLPPVVTGTKLAVGYGWRAVVAAESIAATSFGLGFMIFEAEAFMNMEVIYAGILFIAVVGILLERSVFGSIEKSINRWYTGV